MKGISHFGEGNPRGIGIWEYKIFQESVTFPFPQALKPDLVFVGGQENSNYSNLSVYEVCLQIHTIGEILGRKTLSQLNKVRLLTFIQERLNSKTELPFQWHLRAGTATLSPKNAIQKCDSMHFISHILPTMGGWVNWG